MMPVGRIVKLPNANRAQVEEPKIVDYLLNASHRHGASKARFFVRFGFRVEDWRQLAAALAEHGQSQDVAATRETGHGPRFVVVGELKTPDGRRPRVCSVWQLDRGEIAPRLITAYPAEDL